MASDLQIATQTAPVVRGLVTSRNATRYLTFIPNNKLQISYETAQLEISLIALPLVYIDGFMHSSE